MLDDDGCALLEFLDGFDGSIQVDDIVEGELLALELEGIGDARFSNAAFDIKGRRLVRIFAIAQILSLFDLQGKGGGIFLNLTRQPRPQIVGNRTVVGGSMLETP